MKLDTKAQKKTNRIARAEKRRYNKRRRNNIRSKEERTEDDTCPYCGGRMTYCNICHMWSSNCCVDYGTCECS